MRASAAVAGNQWVAMAACPDWLPRRPGYRELGLAAAATFPGMARQLAEAAQSGNHRQTKDAARAGAWREVESVSVPSEPMFGPRFSPARRGTATGETGFRPLANIGCFRWTA